MSADVDDGIERVHRLANKVRGIVDEIDETPTAALFLDPDALETLAYLRESCEAAERAVDRVLAPGELDP